jgi:dipeptidyl aminopeptidase/acylaminoacyl peptidase
VSSEPDPVAGAAARLRPWLEVVLASGPEVGADPETVLFVQNDAGYLQPYRVPRARGPVRRLLSTEDRVGAVLPSPMGPEVILSRDRGGDEHWQLELLDLATDHPTAVALTSDPSVIHRAGAWSPDGRWVYFTSNARDRRFFDVHRLDPHRSDPPETLLAEDNWIDLLEARDDRLLAARRITNLDTDLLLGHDGSWELLNPHTEEQVVFSATIARDGVYAAANPGRELAALVRIRRPGSVEFVREYPGDVEIVRAAPDGENLLTVVNRGGVSETHLVHPASGEDRPLLSGPKGVISSVAWCPDGAGFAYALSSSEGSEIYYRSVETGKERRLTRSPAPPPAPSVDPRLATFRATDGLEVPFFEYRPPGGPDRGTIVYVHGGPESQFRPSFSPVIQFLIHEGYRVVAPNVRGSLGYGRTYVHRDDGPLRMDSVRDLRDLVGALHATGRAEAGRIAVAGGSYGGFMVLAALTSYPELFAAGIDIVGISNFLTFLERTGPWRRRLREAEYGRLDRDREMLREISPLFRADQIRAPLFVVHGRNDPRVPFHEAEQIVETLGGLGRPVELLDYGDEGHGLHRREHQLETWSRAAVFLARYLGAGAPGEAARR